MRHLLLASMIVVGVSGVDAMGRAGDNLGVSVISPVNVKVVP